MKMHVSESMSKNLLTALSTENLTPVYDRMQKRGIRHLLVIDEQGELAGIISDRDLQRGMDFTKSELKSSSAHPTFIENAIVKDFMTTQVTTVPEEAPMTDAIHKMIDLKISALGVTKDSKVTGILTTHDLLRTLDKLLKGQTSGSFLEQLTYNSPVGPIAHMLSQAGI